MVLDKLGEPLYGSVGLRALAAAEGDGLGLDVHQPHARVPELLLRARAGAGRLRHALPSGGGGWFRWGKLTTVGAPT